MNLHTKYQRHGPSGLGQYFLKGFPYMSLYKTSEPNAGPFLIPGL